MTGLDEREKEERLRGDVEWARARLSAEAFDGKKANPFEIWLIFGARTLPLARKLWRQGSYFVVTGMIAGWRKAGPWNYDIQVTELARVLPETAIEEK